MSSLGQRSASFKTSHFFWLSLLEPPFICRTFGVCAFGDFHFLLSARRVINPLRLLDRLLAKNIYRLKPIELHTHTQKTATAQQQDAARVCVCVRKPFCFFFALQKLGPPALFSLMYAATHTQLYSLREREKNKKQIKVCELHSE